MCVGGRDVMIHVRRWWGCDDTCVYVRGVMIHVCKWEELWYKIVNACM